MPAVALGLGSVGAGLIGYVLAQEGLTSMEKLTAAYNGIEPEHSVMLDILERPWIILVSGASV